MPDEERVHIGSDDDVVTARQKGRELATKLGFSSTDLTLVATAISEIARNITIYAGEGDMCLKIVHKNGRRGLTVIAKDRGPGIADLTLAMQDGYTSGRGMGLGLPGSRRLMDEFDIDSVPGKGTTVKMTKWGPRE